MGTRGWMLSTFVGCYIWILHGLGAAAIPVTTEGPFTAGTASPIPAESEGPQALVIGTAETTTAAADAEIAESILAGSLSSPSISPGTELDALVTAASEYGSTRPTLMNVTKPLNSSQDSERASAAPAVATTTASISAQHPAVTPEAELDITRATPSTPLGTTPLFTDVKEDILVAVTREGTEDLDSTPGSVSLPTTPPPAAASGVQPTAGSTVGAGVTALPSQGLTAAMGAVKEGVTLPVDIQSEASADSSSTSPGAEDLLMTQQDGVVSEAVGITPEPTTEMAPAAEEGPLALVSGNTGDAVNGEFSTSSSSHLPPESPTVSGTVGNPGEPSLLPGQVELNPAASLTPPVSGDGDGQGAPRVLSEVPGSGLSPAASEATMAPGLTEDMATSLLGSSVPADAQSDSNLPVPATALPRGDTGAMGLAKPAPWQIPTREQPLFPSPMDTSSSPGAAYPSPGAGASTLPAADDEAETPASLDLGVAQGTSVSPSLGGSQPWGTAAGGSQGVDGPDTGLNSASDASTPASFLPDELTQPAAEVQGQGVEDAGDMAQAGGPGDGSPYADSQSDTNASAFSAQQDPTTTGDLAAGGTETLANAELSPLSPLEDGAGAGEVPGLGQVSLTGPAPPGSAGLEPNLSGAEGPGGLPIDSPSISEAAYPPPGAAAGPVSGAETPASPDLGAVQGVPISPSPEESQPWGTAAGGSQGVDGPDTGLSSASDDSTPDGLTQPAAGVQSQGVEGAEDMTQAGGPGDGSPYSDSQSDTNASAFSAQQDPTTTGDLAAGGTETLANAELSPLSPLEDGAGAGEVPGLGQVSLTGPAPPGSAGLEPDSSGAEGPGDLPSESNSISEAAYPPPGAAAGPVSGADTPASPDLGSVWGVPVSPSPEESQPWGTAAGAFQGAGLPGAKGPGTSLALAWDAPSSPAYGPAGLPSAALGDQLGTNLGLPTAEAHGASTAEQALGGAGSETGLEPPLSSAAGSGMAPGMDQLPGEGSSSSAASPNGVVAAPSVLDPASPSALGGAGSAPGALHPSLGAGPGVPPAAGEGAGEGAGDEESLGQSQASDIQGSADSGAHDKEMASVLQSASSSPSTEESSSAGTTSEATNGASLPGTGGTRGGLSTGLETAGPEEPPMSVPGIQSGADLGLSDAKLSQVNVVEVPGGASVNGAPSSGASLGEGAGAIIQIAAGALAPSALASPQEVQPLVPVASESSGGSNGMASSLAASLLLPGHGLSSGLAPNGDPHSAPDTQSGSKSLEPGAPGGLSGDAGGDQTWSLEDEVASGMPAPLGEAFPHAPVSPNAAPALPSALRGENAAEGVSTSPGLSSPFSARKSIAGSSAGGRGELGAAAPGGSALPLPPHQPGSPGAPSRDADSPMPGDASAMLPGAMAGRGDMAQLLPSATGAGESVETPARTLQGGSPGLPPAGIAAGRPGSKTPGPAGVSSPSALQPVLGHELTTSLAKEAPAAGGSNLPAALPGQGGAQGGSPTTARSAMSCSPATTSPALPAPLPRGREVLPRPGAATVSSHASSPMFPAPPRGPAAAQIPLPGPTVAAVPLYRYGARENDREYVERKVDFNSPLFKPETGFPFGKTLRNSLYFTDNGQIIFPSSDNSVFTYPNPPASGFNGHEEVPMIAVFWDNADFSRGIGTTFYQEFLTLNTAKPPFVRDVEAKVRQYLRSSYSAAWTLKITWEKAPAYAARTDTRRTITYQAILTTDGFRSYILMLYQEGGMQWDYTRLAATNVLIGYTSGDGFYRNDDLTQRPPAAKYRPDQFRGYNTDLRGLWIYKLESRVGVNYRLKCLAWTGRQQEPQAWSQDLPTCPCSLQQGQQDPRFKNSRRGWWAARVSMLHSASPNQHGAGIRCLYDSQGQLIEGRQERYWRSSRQASPYRDQELKLYDWCCNQAGSARLCAHYSNKRPKIGCDGYQSPGTGSSEEAESDSEEQRDGDDE